MEGRLPPADLEQPCVTREDLGLPRRRIGECGLDLGQLELLVVEVSLPT